MVTLIFLFSFGLACCIYFLFFNNGTKEKVSTISTTTQSQQTASKGSYTVVDTMQDVCSNDTSKITCPDDNGAFYGQDAQYQGNQAIYTDNGNGTITDNVTGLMWQQNPGDKMDYENAINGVENFNLAGYTDWRVPTIKELYSLMDFRGIDLMTDATSGTRPFINTNYFKFKYGDTSTGDRIIDSQWVTNTTYKSTVMNGQECFFGVNFADGRIKCYPTRAGKGYYSIYVRGNAYGNNSFLDNGDGTISDLATGLMWQQDDNGKGVVWKDALAYCENLELAGNGDWRIPNAKELQSIVDYTRSPDTTNSAAMDPLFNATKIKNELGLDDYAFYWTGTTHISYPNKYDQAAYISFGRAMGYMEQFGGWVDVHGAGSQRSDPKSGDPSKYPTGLGPQGDARRIYNYVRCVTN